MSERSIDCVSTRLFRRHVTGRSDHNSRTGAYLDCWRFGGDSGSCLFGQLCEPEIKHLHIAIGPHHDVFRFDVAMNDSGFVSGGKSVGDLDGDVKCF